MSGVSTASLEAFGQTVTGYLFLLKTTYDALSLPSQDVLVAH